MVVSIRAELVVPALSNRKTSQEGVVDIRVEYMHGQTRAEAQQDNLESTLSTLLVPHLIDPKGLCVAPQFYVWKVNVDCFVIAGGGGSLLDACSIGIRSALQKALLPRITLVPAAEGNDDGRPTIQVASEMRSARTIPGVDTTVPVIVTVSILKDRQKTPILIADATAEEEACAFSQIHVVVDHGSSTQKRQSTICALHKTGGGAIPFPLLQDVTRFALEASMSSSVIATNQLQHPLQHVFDVQ